MSIKTNISKKESGFSLVEMLMYVSLLVIILMVLVSISFSFSKSYEQLGALRSAEHTGLTSMERMIRDIHSASGIDMGLSVFGTSPGALAVVNGTTVTRFYVVDGEMRVDVDGNFIGPLSVSSAKITNLVFRNISSDQSQAIKIDMTVEGKRGSVTKTKTFHTTVILKRS